MAHSNRNFAVAYLFLVAFPVLGLVGILRSGRALTAPLSVGGSWKIQAISDQSTSSPCAGSLAALDGALTISQSGPNFTLSFGGSPTTSSGSINGTTITSVASPPPVAAAAGCGNRTFSLTASLDPNSSPLSMSGTISINDCAACVPISFRAVRRERAKTKGSH